MAIFEVITSIVFTCGATQCENTYTMRDGQLPFDWNDEDERGELLKRYVPPRWFVVGCAHGGAEESWRRRDCALQRLVVCSTACARAMIAEIDSLQCTLLKA